jgi:phosphoglycolate phosphatase-like HAD superfamily hydrolase
MPPDAVVCDWNGTLIRYRDERPLLESLATDLFGASLPLHPFRMLRILRARRPLNALYGERRQVHDFDYVVEMFRIYNKHIVNGAPLAQVHRSIERYARSPATQQALDRRLLRAVGECSQSGKTTGVLSAGNALGIDMTLAAGGFRSHFDFCEAGQLRHSGGKAIAFELTIYRKKPEYLLRLLEERRLQPASTAYVGDSEDDEGCFQIVGYPVVAFLAPDDMKEAFASRYNAFVPKDEQELSKYLRLG